MNRIVSILRAVHFHGLVSVLDNCIAADLSVHL
jgi:hypothetical protein